ncbi:MAG: YjbQ family protein [Cyclobacteriaceae bacterium]
MVYQKEVTLKPYSRGFHLITSKVLEVIDESNIQSGIVQVFIKHTSASLTINENADPTVRSDFESHMNVLVPENAPYYRHTYEGSDDMPAHIKASLMGSSVSFPFSNGRALLGTWQGVYLGEHRDYGGSRKIIITVIGE